MKTIKVVVELVVKDDVEGEELARDVDEAIGNVREYDDQSFLGVINWSAEVLNDVR